MLGAADEIHRCCRDLTVVRHPVRDDDLSALALDLRALLRAVGEAAADDDWRRFLGPLRRFLWNAARSIVPYAQLAGALGVTMGELERALTILQRTVRTETGRATEVLRRFKEFETRADNPMLTAAIRLHVSTPYEVLLLPAVGTELVRLTSEALRAALGGVAVRVLLARDLADLDPVATAALIGPVRDHSSSVLTAPRYLALHVLVQRWLRDDDLASLAAPPFLVDARGRVATVSSAPPEQVGDIEMGRPSSVEGVEAELFDLDALLDRSETSAPGRDGNDPSGDERVPARALMLGGRAVIFLSAEQRVRVLEFLRRPPARGSSADDDAPPLRVERLDADALEPGMFIVERGQSEGPGLQEIVERLLGAEQQGRLDAAQRDWKGRLRAEIRRHGREGVSARLHALGCRHASTLSNIDNWAGDEVILPLDRKCFDAIIRLIGLEDRAGEYWRLGRIRRGLSHSAGHEIDRSLPWLLRDLDREALEREGMQEVLVGPTQDLRVAIYRVEALLSRTFLVPLRQLGVVKSDAVLSSGART